MESFPKGGKENQESEKRAILRKKGKLKRLVAGTILGAALATGAAGAEAQIAKDERRDAKIEQISGSESETEATASRYKKNFEALQKIVAQEHITNKIDFLRWMYGGAIENFLDMRQIDEDIDYLDKLERGKDNPDSFIHRGDPRLVSLGSIVSGAYKERWEKKEIKQEEFSFGGLEQLPGFSPEKLRKLLQKYPPGYLSLSSSGVSFRKEIQSSADDQSLTLGETKGYGVDVMLQKDARSPITIYETPEGMNWEEFVEAFEHEAHHPADWNNSHALTSAERVDMFFEISRRIEAENRFRSGYVEGINEENVFSGHAKKLPAGASERQMLLLVKAAEYWPEIAKAYFKDQAGFQKEHSKDYEIVKKWVQRQSAGKF